MWISHTYAHVVKIDEIVDVESCVGFNVVQINRVAIWCCNKSDIKGISAGPV